MKRIFLTFMLLFSFQETLAIVGGAEAPAGHALHRMVFLLRQTSLSAEAIATVQSAGEAVTWSSSRCAAAALSRRVIITAAHCLADADNHGLELKDAHGQQLDYVVTSKKIHPDYARDTHTDLALAYLDKDLPEDTITVSIPQGGGWPFGLPQVTAAGYGATSGTMTGMGASADLRFVPVQILSYAANKVSIVVDQANGNGGFCEGDSGGPGLIKQNGVPYIFGIASSVTPFIGMEDSCRFRGEYVNVEYFSDWILKTQKSLESQNQ